MPNYSFTVHWSDEDTAYIALCVEFPGLSGIGDSPDLALAELRLALGAAIDIHRAEGWDLPAPHRTGDHSGRFVVRLPKSLHGRLASQAVEEGVSLNTLVVSALAEAVGTVVRSPSPKRVTPHQPDKPA